MLLSTAAPMTALPLNLVQKEHRRIMGALPSSARTISARGGFRT